MSLLVGWLFVVAVHEEAHATVARLLGYPARVGVGRRGFFTLWGSDDVISPRRDRRLVAAAGPLSTALVAFVAYLSGFEPVTLAALLVLAVCVLLRTP